MSNLNRSSNRLNNWDYASCAYYYVTICVAKHRLLLSNIQVRLDGRETAYTVSLTTIGSCIQRALDETVERFEQVHVPKYVIMPNHIHMIIAISRPGVTLGRIVGYFKSTATRYVHGLSPDIELWQRNYHEHVIRDGNDFERIWNYIGENPRKWTADKYHEGTRLDRPVGAALAPPDAPPGA